MTPSKRQHTDMSAADHHQLLEPSQAALASQAAGRQQDLGPLTFSLAHQHQHGWDGHLDVHQKELYSDQDRQLHFQQALLQDEARLQQHGMPPAGDAEGGEEELQQEQEQEQGGGGGHVTAAIGHVLLTTVRQYFDTEVAPRTADIEQNLAHIQFENNSTTAQATAEKEGLQRELHRVSELVAQFQQRIMEVLE